MKSPRLLDGIWIHFESLPDPRRTLTRCDQSAHDILTIAILAILCGAEGWEDIEQFGLLREQWLRTFLTLTHGISSEQTFRRFFARLRPKAFAECFARWVQTLIGSSDGKLINIDGKTLRRSFDHATGRTALHIVHAWCADNAMLLAQHAVDAKSNEITAIPELLKLLDLRGALVSIDAMGTQKEIANDIVRAGGDYLLALEDNHPTVYHEITTSSIAESTPAMSSRSNTSTKTTADSKYVVFTSAIRSGGSTIERSGGTSKRSSACTVNEHSTARP